MIQSDPDESQLPSASLYLCSVWTDKRIIRLFDSIMRGYPISSFLFWQPRGTSVSYRLEVQAQLAISLPDKDAEIQPVLTGTPQGKAEPELDRLSNILNLWNEHLRYIDWKDKEKVRKVITEDDINRVSTDRENRPKAMSQEHSGFCLSPSGYQHDFGIRC